MSQIKKLILILGDQLDHQSQALKAFNSECDEIIMIESSFEAEYVWSHQAKIVLFLSAMRHFAKELNDKNYPLTYIKESSHSIVENLRSHFQTKQYDELVCVEPGEWRLKQDLVKLASELSIKLVMLGDQHFYCSAEQFKAWVANKKEIRLEYFYRHMRKTHHILIDDDGEPVGGKWNFDDQNRKAFPKKGPGLINPPAQFKPDQITQEVIDFVKQRYASHPGSLEYFAWPVNREQALIALDEFVEHRLIHFGIYQDAMWSETPFAWHSLLSCALNLKLLNPREVIQAAINAWKKHHLDLTTIEGFVRQIIGWREFVRGMYFLDMPKMAEDNFFDHHNQLPKWYWTGDTKMRCMQDAIGQTLKYGYAHHIQRLMITGNFALLAEMLPQDVCSWYLAVYVDAIEWVELPNTAGMALFTNGGRFTSKPYVASGAYIKRMSNYCQSCTYKPEIRFGENACPVSNLYWNFLIKHQKMLESNPRTSLMTAHLRKIDDQEKLDIVDHAKYLLKNLDEL